MRLFIAAQLSTSVVEALAETAPELRECVQGRIVPPSNYHVTLVFLGERRGSDLVRIQDAIDAACEEVEQIDTKLGSFGNFGRARKATLWQALESEGKLEDLALRVRVELARREIEFDNKSFLAHITLARNVDVQAASELPMARIAGGAIERVALFRSDLSGDVPRYEELYTVELGK